MYPQVHSSKCPHWAKAKTRSRDYLCVSGTQDFSRHRCLLAACAGSWIRSRCEGRTGHLRPSDTGRTYPVEGLAQAGTMPTSSFLSITVITSQIRKPKPSDHGIKHVPSLWKGRVYTSTWHFIVFLCSSCSQPEIDDRLSSWPPSLFSRLRKMLSKSTFCKDRH